MSIGDECGWVQAGHQLSGTRVTPVAERAGYPEVLRSLAIEGAVIVELDLRDASAGDRLVAAAIARHGQLDGVVNAAGIVAFGSLEDLDDVIVEELFMVNVLGPLWLMRRLVPPLRAAHGFVVNVSAVVAEQPLPDMAVYSATKAALTAADSAGARVAARRHPCVRRPTPPHTETGLAGRAVAGHAPRLPVGLDPERVAERIVHAIERNEQDVPSTAFTSPDG